MGIAGRPAQRLRIDETGLAHGSLLPLRSRSCPCQRGESKPTRRSYWNRRDAPRLDSERRFPKPPGRIGGSAATGQFVPRSFVELDRMMVSTIILCIPYAAIIWDKLNRAIVALIGAALMVGSGALDQNEALKGIDWNTIGLLTGMMILVSVSRRSGMFEYLAI